MFMARLPSRLTAIDTSIDQRLPRDEPIASTCLGIQRAPECVCRPRSIDRFPRQLPYDRCCHYDNRKTLLGIGYVGIEASGPNFNLEMIYQARNVPSVKVE